jgi:uncharacterized protein YhdP
MGRDARMDWAAEWPSTVHPTPPLADKLGRGRWRSRHCRLRRPEATTGVSPRRVTTTSKANEGRVGRSAGWQPTSHAIALETGSGRRRLESLIVDADPDIADWERGADERAQVHLQRVAEVRARTAEALAVSAELAARHAQRAAACGDFARAEHERAIARRVRATVERLRARG